MSGYMLLCLLLLPSRLESTDEGEFSGLESGNSNNMTPIPPNPPNLLFCDLFPEKCDVDCPCGIFNTLVVPSFFPCAFTRSFASFEGCDAFIHIAADQAKERLRQFEELYLFADNCFQITLRPIAPETIEDGIFSLVANLKNDKYVGVLSPYDTGLSEIINFFTQQQLQIITIAYTSSDYLSQNKDRYPYFYSTIPSMSFFSGVKLQLLSDFQWRRVAVLSSDEVADSQAAENFVELATQNVSMEIRYFGSYHSDPTVYLQQMKNDDYRIFLAFVDSSKARNLICKAMKLELTTARHQWILPSYYDYKWWRNKSNCSCYSDSNTVEDECDCPLLECSDEEILDAIQSVIFVGESNSNFIDLNQTKEEQEKFHERFELAFVDYYDESVERKEEDRKYLIHSRGNYAYDAVIVFSELLHAAIERLRDEVFVNDSEGLCEALMGPNEFRTDIDELTEVMIDILENSVYCGASGLYVFSRDNDFGHAWITQFYGETECDIGHLSNFEIPPELCEFEKLLPKSDAFNFNSSNHFVFFNSTGTNLSNLTLPCPYRWKGENPWKAPVDGACYDESCICYNQLGIFAIVSGAVLMIVGIVCSSVMFLLNCLCRSNKHIKSSSPRFNMIIIIGCIMIYPCALLQGLSVSGTNIGDKSIRKSVIPVLCELNKWLVHIGITLIVVTMLARNWRLYRIFYNPRIEERKYVSDRALLVIIIILMAPTTLLLLVWTSYDTYIYEEFKIKFNCPNVMVDDSINTFRIIISCKSEHRTGWEGSLLGYYFLLCILLVFLAYQNSKILSHFAQEGEFATRTIFMIFIAVAPSFLIKVILLLVVNDGESISELYWIDFAFFLLFPTTVLGGLYIPKLLLMYKDWLGRKKTRKLTQIQEELSVRFEEKKEKIDILRIKLRERENSIHFFKGVRGGSFQSLRRESTPLTSPDFAGRGDFFPLIERYVSRHDHIEYKTT